MAVKKFVGFFSVSVSVHTVESGRMMNKSIEHRMCPFCLYKQIGDEHHYIFKCTYPTFIPILLTELFKAISELRDKNTHSYEST